MEELCCSVGSVEISAEDGVGGEDDCGESLASSADAYVGRVLRVQSEALAGSEEEEDQHVGEGGVAAHLEAGVARVVGEGADGEDEVVEGLGHAGESEADEEDVEVHGYEEGDGEFGEQGEEPFS